MRIAAELRARTKSYASKVIRLYVALPRKRREVEVLGHQLLRSGTSVAAHTREASRARSDSEFCSKLDVLLQEADESGVVGSTLVFGAVLALILQAFYHSGSNILAVLFLFVGVSQAFGHAFLDFIFNSPAYWMAFIGLLAVATKLLHLEQAHRQRRGRSAEDEEPILKHGSPGSQLS